MCRKTSLRCYEIHFAGRESSVLIHIFDRQYEAKKLFLVLWTRLDAGAAKRFPTGGPGGTDSVTGVPKGPQKSTSWGPKYFCSCNYLVVNRINNIDFWLPHLYILTLEALLACYKWKFQIFSRVESGSGYFSKDGYGSGLNPPGSEPLKKNP